MSYFQKLLSSFCVAITLMSLWLPTAWAEPVERLLPQPQAVFQTGVTAFQNEDYQQSIAAFTQAIQQQPSFASAYKNRCLT